MMVDAKKESLLGRILLHPVTVFISMGLGIYLGLCQAEISRHLAPIGTMYLCLLQMCVLPIMISAVMLSVGRLLISGDANNCIRRVTVVFVIGMLVAATVGAGMALAGKLGKNLASEHKALLGKEIARIEMEGNNPTPSKTDRDDAGFISQLIPTNIFSSLAEGHTLPVLFFCLIVGVALGSIEQDQGNRVLDVIDATYEAMLKVVAWLLYGLPVGLCSLFADQVGRIGIAIFLALFRLVLFTYLASFIMLLIYSIFIWRKSKKSYLQSLLAMRKAIIVALGTSSSFAALPFALRGLHDDLGFEKKTVDLVMPLGITLNPHGNILCFAMVGVFMANLYDVPLTIPALLTILMTSILAGVAASSAPGIAALAMLSLVLNPLGLPVVVAVVLITSINPVIDPILTAVNIHANCAAAATVVDGSSNSDRKTSEST